MLFSPFNCEAFIEATMDIELLLTLTFMIWTLRQSFESTRYRYDFCSTSLKAERLIIEQLFPHEREKKMLLLFSVSYLSSCYMVPCFLSCYFLLFSSIHRKLVQLNSVVVSKTMKTECLLAAILCRGIAIRIKVNQKRKTRFNVDDGCWRINFTSGERIFRWSRQVQCVRLMEAFCIFRDIAFKRN